MKAFPRGGHSFLVPGHNSWPQTGIELVTIALTWRLARGWGWNVDPLQQLWLLHSFLRPLVVKPEISQPPSCFREDSWHGKVGLDKALLGNLEVYQRFGWGADSWSCVDQTLHSLYGKEARTPALRAKEHRR